VVFKKGGAFIRQGEFVREGRLIQTCQLRGALIRQEAFIRERAFIRSFTVFMYAAPWLFGYFISWIFCLCFFGDTVGANRELNTLQ